MKFINLKKLFYPVLFVLLFIGDIVYAQKQKSVDMLIDTTTAQKIRRTLNDLSADAYLKQSFSNNSSTLNYRLLQPVTSKKTKYPLIITLHNSSRIGNDNESQLEPLARIWLQPEIRNHYPAFVIAPQFQTRSSNYMMDSLRHIVISKPSTDVLILLELIRYLQRKYPQIDTNRIYLVGYSMGASTAQNLLNIAPEKFAAMISIAGVPDVSNINGINHKPIWLIHGRKDEENVYEGSVQLYKFLTGNSNLEFTTYNQLDHNLISIPFLSTTEIPDWLFRWHRRQKF